MAENIYKTFNNKAQCAHALKNRNIIQNFKTKTSLYEIKALTLIEHQLYVQNTLLLIQKLTTIQNRCIGQAFNRLKQKFQVQTINNGSKNERNTRLKVWVLELKIKKMIENSEHRRKLESFKFMKQRWVGKKKVAICELNQQKEIKYKMSKNRNACRVDLSKNIFSNLDISEIEINHGREIILSTSCNQISSMDFNQKFDQQIRLKYQIKQKEEYLQLLQKQYKQSVSQMEQCKNKKKADQSIPSESDISNFEKEKKKEKSQGGDQCLLIGILIKKNFQLEEKLDEVYQLLGAIEPDVGTQFGKRLSKLRRKKCFHISFQNQHSSL